MKDDKQALRAKIVTEAHRLGFAAVGFAAASPARTMPHFEAWLAAGFGANMDFLRKNLALRANPGALAPGVRSIIVAAARYPVNGDPGKGFAMHARSEDYHIVLRGKLEQLGAFIGRERPLSVARVCVDSAPVLEREWAVAAGIGWRGKQGQIVNAELGCCLLLGELMVDIDLEPSTPVANQCGDCRLCVEACPTGALSGDGLVDARKCISYLTIEHKGDIPAELQPEIGEALLGCDRCTAICPWNRFGADRVMPELQPRPMPEAGECLRMTEAEFKTRFKDTVVFRSGLARLQRNASIVMANRNKN
jgi:epoxyqueuosine reductase